MIKEEDDSSEDSIKDDVVGTSLQNSNCINVVFL
jgi:hypothetical protein